jgi:ribosomal protein S18 acetylase RimI-like enzyme
MKIEKYNAGVTVEHLRLFAKLTEDKKLIKLNEFLHLVHADSSSSNIITTEGLHRNHGMRVIVCSSQENVLGFFTWNIRRTTQQAEIFFFAVNKAFRGKKIGKITFLTGIQDIVEFG